MSEYFQIDKVFIPLIVPLIGIFIWLGATTFQINSLTESIEKLVDKQDEYLLTQREVKDLRKDVDVNSKHIEDLRFSKYKNLSVENVIGEEKWQRVP